MIRTAVPVLALVVLIATGCAVPMTTPLAQPFNVVETGIPELRQALAEGRISSRQLVLQAR